ncbi:hypothetical protein NFI96_026507 [Prochilodus magdalenae]|nr:hypothetical protein NFI96_026507 [Prochilodus magdalenae]
MRPDSSLSWLPDGGMNSLLGCPTVRSCLAESSRGLRTAESFESEPLQAQTEDPSVCKVPQYERWAELPAVLFPLPALLGGVEEPDGSRDKGSPESVRGAAL